MQMIRLGCAVFLLSFVHQGAFAYCENNAVEFEFGHNNPPPRKFFGPGAGDWGVESALLRPDLVQLSQAARLALTTSMMRERYGHLTVDTFARYFENTGEALRLDMAQLLAQSLDLKKNIRSLLTCLHSEMGGLQLGKHLFSMKSMVKGKFERKESEELYLAIADYAYFMTGKLEVQVGGVVDYEITIGLYDRYDWDPGVVIPIKIGHVTVPVSQDFVGSFHRAGLAMEFDVVANAKIKGSTLL